MKIINLFRIFMVKIGLVKPTFYINGPETLPAPLDAEEEIVLLNQNTDKSRDKLIVHNLRLVVYIARKFDTAGINLEDLISIGTIGLIKAVNTFKPDKNIKLATYASRCIENEILMFFRSKKKDSNLISVNEPIDTDSEGNPLTLIDIIYCDDTISDDIDLKKKSARLYELIDAMADGRDKEIIIRRYGLYNTKELTQREIADKMGISRSYVSRIEKRILGELREKF